MAGKGETGILTLYSDVQATSVRWLWYPFIAVGKITLLQGDPGDGKYFTHKVPVAFPEGMKGSKNKPKMVNDFASQIAEKQSTIESLNTEIASITANIDSLKAELKTKRAALKSAEKEVSKLEAKKAKEDQKAAEEAKEAEAEAVLKKLLADGMSAEEILAKLK